MLVISSELSISFQTSGSMPAQLVTQSGENYVVHGAVDASGQIAHTIRASPATVSSLSYRHLSISTVFSFDYECCLSARLPPHGHISDVMSVWRKGNINRTVSVLQYCGLL